MWENILKLSYNFVQIYSFLEYSNCFLTRFFNLKKCHFWETHFLCSSKTQLCISTKSSKFLLKAQSDCEVIFVCKCMSFKYIDILIIYKYVFTLSGGPHR